MTVLRSQNLSVLQIHAELAYSSCRVCRAADSSAHLLTSLLNLKRLWIAVCEARWCKRLCQKLFLML